MDAVRAAVADALSRATGAVYVGLSGGRDSCVLLHAVSGLRRSGVVAVHVNHGLHDDAAKWQQHCESLARALGVEFLARRVSVPARGSVEARAREARYEVFESLLGNAGSHLLLAHHAHDQTETVLLRLLQGRGLYGMPRQRPLAEGVLVRPLLQLAAGELDEYARRHGLTWVEDPANSDLSIDRSYLRQRIVPELRRRWPDVDRLLADAAERVRRAERRLAAPFGDLGGQQGLELARLQAYEPAEAVELLRLWLQAEGIASPGRPALAELLRQLHEAGPDRQPSLEVAGAVVRRFEGRLHVVPAVPALAGEYPLALPGITPLPHGELQAVQDAGGFTAWGKVSVRFRRGGERLRCGAMERPLKALLHGARIPPWERPDYPLLFDERGLLAVPGIASREDGDRPGGARWRVVWRPKRL